MIKTVPAVISETSLTISNVNTNQFGLLFTRAVDDYIYPQPLYLPKVSIGGNIHNVVYVATINNPVCMHLMPITQRSRRHFGK